MNLKDKIHSVIGGIGAGGKCCLPFPMKKQKLITCTFVLIFVLALIGLCLEEGREEKAKEELEQQQIHLLEVKRAEVGEKTETKSEEPITETKTETKTEVPQMLEEYKALYNENSDIIGWLKIEDTVIDYPVMQTPEDESYYLTRGFDKEENKNGCLVLDTDSTAGIGTAENDYQNGISPSTNLIIHGHTMKSGAMFGKLKLYQDKEYGMEHKIICFDSLYEKRKYELIAVFYSQVFYESEDVFKY